MQAILPTAPDRPLPVDLLLCGNHYRRSQRGLAASGAVVYDAAGFPLSPAPAPPALLAARARSSGGWLRSCVDG